MRLMDWKDEYSVGIPDIDDEHRQLIETINRLHEELDSPNCRETVPVFFTKLMEEISAHFTHEEEFMREHRYVKFDPHREDHERLLDDLRDMKEAFERAVEVDSVELSLRLDEWFFHHFRSYDMQLHAALGPHEH